MTSELRRASHPGRGIGESGFLRTMVGDALWVAAALAILSAGWVSPAAAVAFGVDSTVDAVDANPGDGACAAASGACTLRAAIHPSNVAIITSFFGTRIFRPFISAMVLTGRTEL